MKTSVYCLRCGLVLVITAQICMVEAAGVKLPEAEREKVQAAMAKAKVVATRQIRLAMGKAKGPAKAELRKQLEAIQAKSFFVAPLFAFPVEVGHIGSFPQSLTIEKVVSKSEVVIEASIRIGKVFVSNSKSGSDVNDTRQTLRQFICVKGVDAENVANGGIPGVFIATSVKQFDKRDGGVAKVVVCEPLDLEQFAEKEK